jgi:hypothetical protein
MGGRYFNGISSKQESNKERNVIINIIAQMTRVKNHNLKHLGNVLP